MASIFKTDTAPTILFQYRTWYQKVFINYEIG